jgi:hypothetical protein
MNTNNLIAIVADAHSRRLRDDALTHRHVTRGAVESRVTR